MPTSLFIQLLLCVLAAAALTIMFLGWTGAIASAIIVPFILAAALAVRK